MLMRQALSFRKSANKANTALWALSTGQIAMLTPGATLQAKEQPPLVAHPQQHVPIQVALQALATLALPNVDVIT